jgi:hypothetical protein
MTGRFEMVRGDFGNVTDRTGLRERAPGKFERSLATHSSQLTCFEADARCSGADPQLYGVAWNASLELHR